MIAVRSRLFDVAMALLTATMGIVCLPALIDRRAARAMTRVWARCALGALNLICGMRHRVIGEENIPAGAAIVASNHQSMWETIALLALLPRPAIVFKKELLRIPVYGLWARRTGVPVDRSGGAKAIRMLRRETERHVARGDQIVVFPEGTRGPPGGLGPLQPGIAAMYLIADVPAAPVVHNSGEFWRHPGGLKEPGEIAIRFLPAIDAKMPRRNFMKALDAALRQDPEAASSIPGGEVGPT